MKTALSTLMIMLSMHVSAQLCRLNVQGKSIELAHIYVLEHSNSMRGGKSEWVVFCVEEPLADTQLDVKNMSFNMSVQDLYGVSVVIDSQDQQITAVKLSWHDNTFAMISGVLGQVQFNGEATEKHLKGEVKSLKKLNAQQSAMVNGELLTDEVDWHVVVHLDHAVLPASGDQ